MQLKSPHITAVCQTLLKTRIAKITWYYRQFPGSKY